MYIESTSKTHKKKDSGIGTYNYGLIIDLFSKSFGVRQYDGKIVEVNQNETPNLKQR